MGLVTQRRSKAFSGGRRPAFILAVMVAALTIATPAPAQATPSVAKAWGAGAEGQLGNGTSGEGNISNVPVAVSEVSGVAAVSGGGRHSLALLENGTVVAWGANGKGQLGNGTTNMSDVPVAVSALTGVVAVSAGNRHSLALLSDGTVMAWGNNNSGQLGDGTTESSTTAVPVSGLSGAVAISAGGNHSVALLGNGTVMAWGDNEKGQLGDGTTISTDIPVAVTGLSGVVGISGGNLHSLALLSDGTVMAWGSNLLGQLGDGTETNRAVPVAVAELSGVASVAAGGFHSLARLTNGSVMAWGGNEHGQLGDGTKTGPNTCGELPIFACSKTPVAVSGLSGVSAIAAGSAHSMALLGNGMVMAWGDNTYGELGDGTSGETTDSDVAVEVSKLSAVVGISAGERHSLSFGPPPPPPSSLPELGRCVKVGTGGKYKSKGCSVSSAKGNGAYEWLPGPGAKPKFAVEIGEVELETVGKAKVSCGFSELTGEWTGGKTASVNLRFQGCLNTTTAKSCQSNPLQPAQITTSTFFEGEEIPMPIEGELGFIKKPPMPQVGLDLKPTEGSSNVLSFSCGGSLGGEPPEPWTVEGSAIGRIRPLAAMGTAIKMNYKAVGGKQLPEFFEGQPKDTLISKRTVGVEQKTEQAGLTFRSEPKAGTVFGEYEEPLEIRAK
jgi:alpha-tubulin suppressor-like RCC1 family protein